MMTIRQSFLAILLMFAIAAGIYAQTPQPTPTQQPQNPSPMVEHTRAHPRLIMQRPPGQRYDLSLGKLFIPARYEHSKRVKLLIFFHGGAWIPEVAAAAQKRVAVIAIQAGAGSGTYEKLFDDPARFPALIAEAETTSGLKFSEIDLGGWSAGCGAERKLLRDPDSYSRIARVLCIDGVHAGYITGTPGPLESQLNPDNLESWLRFGRDAIAGKKRLMITHSEIFPGAYASTTETADYLIHNWGLESHAVLEWGPQKTQMLSRTQSGRLLILGFAGNSAPDHIDQIHSLPIYLRWLLEH